MQLLREISDTIAALATPLSRGALSVVRISGPSSIQIAQRLTKKQTFSSRKMNLCRLYDQENFLIDQALVVYFKAPFSFTGEDVVEIQCHGNPLIVQKIQELCCQYGARVAQPGEFLQRAYYNKKYDLAQIEAINALIHARTKEAVQHSLQLAQGKMAERITDLNNQIIQIRVLLESSIDFSEEPEIDDYLIEQGIQKLDLLIQQTQAAVSQADRSLALHTGLKVCLIGAPNAGKSSLINAFAGQELAIVDEQAGTTRDLIRHELSLGGIPISIIDTAGLRETTNSIEQRGILKAKQEALQSQVVIYIAPAGTQMSREHQDFLLTLPAKRILLHNKIDLDLPKTHGPHEIFQQVFAISLKTGQGWQEFNEGFKNWILGENNEEGFHVVSSRQLNVLKEFLEFLLESRHNKKAELMAESLYRAQQVLNRLTQDNMTQDDLLGKIFSTFCIGK